MKAHNCEGWRTAEIKLLCAAVVSSAGHTRDYTVESKIFATHTHLTDCLAHTHTLSLTRHTLRDHPLTLCAGPAWFGRHVTSASGLVIRIQTAAKVTV